MGRIRPNVPMRVQHRRGAMWVLNSAALAGRARTPRPSGRRTRPGRRADRSDPARRRFGLGRTCWRPVPDIPALGRVLAGYGITAVTDGTSDLEPAVAASLTTLPQQ